MLKKFEVENFKNFKDKISINFDNVGGYKFSIDCLYNGLISKMFIYGKNATGKTNLESAILDIKASLMDTLQKDDAFINADSEEKCAKFKYTFLIDENIIVYVYHKGAYDKMLFESLMCNGKEIYYVDFVSKKYDFNNLKLIHAETAVIERYLQTLNNNEDNNNLPFFRWMINNVVFHEDSVIVILTNYISRMYGHGATTSIFSQLFSDKFFERLSKEGELEKFEKFLNTMGVDCKLVLKTLPDNSKQLYFKHKKLISFNSSASSGTISLMHLYNGILMFDKKPSFIYFDEFDAFYHYEMSENLIKYLKDTYPDTQIIFTSHNTNLISNQILRPDCVFILSTKGKLTAFCDATKRELREGHNLEKMYISGEFENYE